MTLRQAFHILEREGLIESQRRRGTFVAPNRLQKQQQEIRSFTEEIRARRKSHVTGYFVQSDRAASVGQRVFWPYRRGESLRDQPPALQGPDSARCGNGVNSTKNCPWLERFDLTQHSLYQILEESYGLQLQAGVEEISAELPSAVHRKLLCIPKNTAVLVILGKHFWTQASRLKLLVPCIEAIPIARWCILSVKRKV